jgi:glycosyltransferase involved in cell wall biosynthesis
VIPLGIDIEHFPRVSPDRRAAARAALDVPADAFVVGSFQKDGVGWGEGLEPKLIKGPDVLVAALERVKATASDLFVMLTGPARGYVCGELERLGILYRHDVARSRSALAQSFHALDVYVVASRQEGGPKGVLEAMAAGVPLVTTRVGQAPALVEEGVNGFLVEVEDAEAIAAAALRIREDSGRVRALTEAGRATAEQYAYERLDGLWSALLDGFVER